MVIPAIVLAAGKSTRMGRIKASLSLGVDETFLTRIVSTLLDAGVDDVVVVVGHESQRVMADFSGSRLAARFVENPDYERGQLSSLLAGLAVVDRPGVAGTLITLVDVPLVKASTVRTVMDHYQRTRALIVRPTHGAEHGHPLLVDRDLFDAFRQADPAAGAKPVVHAHLTADSGVEVDDPGAFFDVDTPQAYEAALDRLKRPPT